MTNIREKPASSAQRAVEDLRRLIFSGELPPGSDHLETELAEQLGMSRTPVREAALMLESQGLVEVRPRRGVRILPVSPHDMAEIYDILTELESLAAERAADTGYTEEQLKGLGEAIADMDLALADRDLLAWADADDRFHAELVRLGGNSRLEAIAAMMSDQVRRARTVTLFMRPVPARSNDDHRSVFVAIAEGKAQVARTRHREHRQHAKRMLLDLLERHRLHRL